MGDVFDLERGRSWVKEKVRPSKDSIDEHRLARSCEEKKGDRGILRDVCYFNSRSRVRKVFLIGS